MPTLLYLASINILITCIGYVFVGKKMIISSWILCIASVTVSHFVFLPETPLIRMFALITTAFTGMKVIAATAAYLNKLKILSFGQWIAFVFTWAGMRTEIFERKVTQPLPGAKRIIAVGMVNIAAGFLLIRVCHVLAVLAINPALQYAAITALLLIAFSLILHFGLLNISAGGWRYFGVDTYYLFKKPFEAKTLNEFWSKRWNIAFSEMTSITVFRPLKQYMGTSFALVAAFIFSGILHELAISVPVRNGYGLPMLYFIIQGVAVVTEKVFIQKKIISLQNDLICRVWLFFWLIVPIPLLFHKPFVYDIIWTLAGLHVPHIDSTKMYTTHTSCRFIF